MSKMKSYCQSKESFKVDFWRCEKSRVDMSVFTVSANVVTVKCVSSCLENKDHQLLRHK